MRNKSNLYLTKENKQNSQQPQFRGGVSKVMKKKLAAFVLSSSMVLSLAVPAFAAATNSDPTKEPGAYLKEIGVIKGDQNGDLLEDSNWKRQDVTVLLSTLLKQKEEAKATANTHGFTDVRGTNYDGFISWAKENKYMVGLSATEFGFDAEITYHDFAAIVLRALGFQVAYADVPTAAVEAKILPEGTDFSAKATRGDSYKVIVGALNTVIPGSSQTLGNKLGLPGFEAASTATVTAIAANKLQVTFNQPADDTKAKFEVKNGNIAVNYKTLTFADDKKSAVLEFANSLAAADYTVSVSGLTETAITATVKVEAQKVAKIELTSEKAVLKRSATNEVTVGYKVLDQYGTEINSTVLEVTAGKTGANAVANNGVLTVTGGTYNIGDKFAVSLIHSATGAFVSGIVEVAQEAKVAAIDIVKLHEADNKELQVGGTAENFALVLDLKDQYGNAFKTAANIADDVIVTVSNPTVANVKGGSIAPVFEVADRDGDGNTEAYIKLDGTLTAGTSTVTIISRTSGAKDTFDVVVKDAIKVDALTLSAPTVAPAGEVVEIPYTAVDQFGNTIANPTDAQVVSATATGTGSTVHFVKDVVKNTTALKLDLTNMTTEGNVYVTVVSGTNKVSQLVVSVVKPAVATVITGTKDFATSVLVGGTATIGTGNVVVKDQYGRDITPTWGTAVNEYRVAVESGTTSKVTADALAPSTLTGVAKGSSTVTLKLEQNLAGVWTNVTNSSYSYAQKVVEKADITSYEATLDGTVYSGAVAPAAPADYAKEIKVVGVLADGSKVAIPAVPANFSVAINTTGVSVAAGKVSADTNVVYESGKTDAEATAIVTVYGASTPQVITVPVKLSSSLPAITTLSLVTNGVATKEEDGLISATVANANSQAKVEALVVDAVKAVDQYGIELTDATTDYNVYVSNITDNKLLTAVSAGNTFNVTVVSKSNKTITFKVVVK
jgi:hypothetical protein